jgi:hypothetical protein
MTDYKKLCAELLKALEIQLDELAATNRLCKKARAALAEPMYTVDDLHCASRGNYMVEDECGITLDGFFTRQELLELAYSKPLEVSQ